MVMKNTTKCDKRGCANDAAWTYRISTLGGVENWHSCQPHVREVREMHGQNIMEVSKVR